MLPVASADLSGNEEKYVVDAIRSSWVSSTGKYIDQFESQFAELCGAKYAISCTNGTVALHLAMLGLGLRPGDEVIVPSMTYIATANAVRYCGAEPVFVDVDPDTRCISPAALEGAISSKTRGIVAVHFLGHPADMDAINEVAAMHGLWVVEDAAEAHFAEYKGRTVGSLGTVSTFSFYGNKIFTCGEGGAVTLNDPQLLVRLKMLRGQGMDPKRRYYFPITGYNFRLTNVACAMLCAQLERKDEILGSREAIFARYRAALSEISGVSQPPVAPWARVAPWMYSITIDPSEFGLTRDQLMGVLSQAGVESRPFFYPLHRLPPFAQSALSQGQPMDVTNQLGETGIMLPTYNNLSLTDVEQVASAIREASSSSDSYRRSA